MDMWERHASKKDNDCYGWDAVPGRRMARNAAIADQLDDDEVAEAAASVIEASRELLGRLA